ncbi:hypothetical protein F511_15762 [Dorcoceras hygrometricum]|uniref:Uncharacterized protein n=1 Tax=Dorcoceras hygrometricum TaxID=472368 RepID=A0A2Z7CQ78_9LAMI|nr:hypothetical protein F511_15762 [Dorcoceras hygrometricum]
MSLFDLQDVCIAIGSIATLDLPMVVDLIGIYGLKGPYSLAAALPPLYKPPPCAASAAARLRRKIVSGQFDEENPFVLISSVLLVQADEGVSFLVMDRIGDFYRNLPRRADVIVTTVGARHKCQQDQNSMRTTATPPPQAAAPLPPAARACVRDNHARWPRMATRRWRCVAVQEAQSLRTVRPRVAATLARSSCVDGRTMSAVARAGRALATRLPHVRRPRAAGHPREMLRTLAVELLSRATLVEAMHAARSTLGARARRDVAWPPPRVFLVVAAPPAGRRSGESPAMS